MFDTDGVKQYDLYQTFFDPILDYRCSVTCFDSFSSTLMIEVTFVLPVQTTQDPLVPIGTMMRTVLSFQILQSVTQTYHVPDHVLLVTIALTKEHCNRFLVH